MKVAIFDAHAFERPIFDELNGRFGHQLTYLDVRLSRATARLAQGFDAICVFTNDHVDATVLSILRTVGVRIVALRCAGFNQVDLGAAQHLGMVIVRVPSYSPHSVAEHATTLILALNRKICKANARVRELNFSLDGLVGFDLHGKTVGIIGTGKIGSVMARIMCGFGCTVLANDSAPDSGLMPGLPITYVSRDELYTRSDIISLHLPLTPQSRHLINDVAIAKMKPGVMLINTGRGALVDTKALIQGLKSGRVGAAGLDVYEEEENIFFEDLSSSVLQDDVLARLLTFPNVLVTSHQAFLTREALHNIAETTLQNLVDFEHARPLVNEVAYERARRLRWLGDLRPDSMWSRRNPEGWPSS